MVHPVASAGDLRSIQRLGAMDEAQVVLPGGIETTETNAREPENSCRVVAPGESKEAASCAALGEGIVSSSLSRPPQ
jgi:hypothetical protein